MKRFFITATGTGIGKTLITCALAHQLRAHGHTVRAVKPVISGFDAARPQESDTGQLLAAQELPVNAQTLESISPWRFAAPLSPDMAAEEEGRSIDFDALVSFCQKQSDVDYVLIEGVGGVMVPLNHDRTVRDWMAALRIPVILVAGSYLGALSHTLEAAHVITSAGLKLHAVIVSESENRSVDFRRMEASLKRFLPASARIAHVARLDSSPELWKYVPNLTPLL